MKFTDFKSKDLIGKTVLVTVGSIRHPSRRISKISRTTAAFFYIEESETKFRISDGAKAGKYERSDWGTICECELITEERANELRAEWNKKKLILKMKEDFKTKIDSLTFEQLEQIEKIINP